MASLIKRRSTRGTWSGRGAAQSVFHYDKSVDGKRVVVMVFDDGKSVAEVRCIKGNFWKGKKTAVEFEASKVANDISSIAAEVHRLAAKHF